MTQRYREAGQLCTQANHCPHKHGFFDSRFFWSGVAGASIRTYCLLSAAHSTTGIALLHFQLPSRLAISQQAGAVLSDLPGRDGWIAVAQEHKHAGLLVAGDKP